MVQTTGYAVAAGGPFLVGALRDAKGGWAASFVAVLAVATVSLVAAPKAGRDVYVG